MWQVDHWLPKIFSLGFHDTNVPDCPLAFLSQIELIFRSAGNSFLSKRWVLPDTKSWYLCIQYSPPSFPPSLIPLQSISPQVLLMMSSKIVLIRTLLSKLPARIRVQTAITSSLEWRQQPPNQSISRFAFFTNCVFLSDLLPFQTTIWLYIWLLTTLQWHSLSWASSPNFLTRLARPFIKLSPNYFPSLCTLCSSGNASSILEPPEFLSLILGNPLLLTEVHASCFHCILYLTIIVFTHLCF